uniref:Palmitoyl-protein thioesterase 1 n=1 Tax=Cyclophora tenuis TaxID=216820 RepID=A0A7S1CYF3_CYCTE
MVDRLVENPLEMASELHSWAKAHGLLINNVDAVEDIEALPQRKRILGSRVDAQSSLPIVFAHGMGDSCFNDGFRNLVKRSSNLMGGVYSVCVPTGKNQAEDTNNGYFLNMDASVEIFAANIRKDPKLANGFHAIGLSQGNNVIRGYIAKHNYPPVHTFISINGVNAGEGAVPYCRPSYKKPTITTTTKNDVAFPSMCDLLMEQASRAAYTTYAQSHSFQANYWRDPRESEFPTYQKYAQLAQWNNEGLVFNQTLKENYARTSKFVWVLATEDGMVWPKEGEQWGAPDPKNPFQHILPREETAWFVQDLFGLRSAEEDGKNFYESFQGDHLRFSMKQYDEWLTKYLS